LKVSSTSVLIAFLRAYSRGKDCVSQFYFNKTFTYLI